MHTIFMFFGCSISNAIDNWKFVARDFLFNSKYNPTFTNGDPTTIHIHLALSRVVIEFSSSFQFWHLRKGSRKLALIQ
jgi:hypothetical protein